jgi:hypothetical protein
LVIAYGYTGAQIGHAAGAAYDMQENVEKLMEEDRLNRPAPYN